MARPGEPRRSASWDRVSDPGTEAARPSWASLSGLAACTAECVSVVSDHTHRAGHKPRGRPSKATPEVLAALMIAIEDGATLRRAAPEAPVDWTQAVGTMGPLLPGVWGADRGRNGPGPPAFLALRALGPGLRLRVMEAPRTRSLPRLPWSALLVALPAQYRL